MDKHGKKMIAPVVITVLAIIYFIAYFGFLLSFIQSGLIKLLLGIIPALLVTGMVVVCIQRIREIKEGEEDDLSQY